MPPKTGKKLHRGPGGRDRREKFEQGISTALKSELGPTHRAVKTLMSWTGASERTAKHWLAGTHGPSGRHLIQLARHSDAVLFYFLAAADRSFIVPGLHLVAMRTKLLDLVEAIDAHKRQ
ncbi:hypothetical protein [Methylovirgula sp. HY1]|uniref:hypothetical protein n=1 Tax=Methylovirgula sp. HY1 TaxID=2822761 RepID=UPI001C5B0373|nr:hypothetical protein [Methylovirgula sp. HY1]QXX76121.1 hypothetical protein MHY1_02956 [Methylovirgula sp. HY1]